MLSVHGCEMSTPVQDGSVQEVFHQGPQDKSRYTDAQPLRAVDPRGTGDARSGQSGYHRRIGNEVRVIAQLAGSHRPVPAELNALFDHEFRRMLAKE
jgi:hypothetical protein